MKKIKRKEKFKKWKKKKKKKKRKKMLNNKIQIIKPLSDDMKIKIKNKMFISKK